MLSKEQGMQLIFHGAILQVLYDKGLVTKEEFENIYLAEAIKSVEEKYGEISTFEFPLKKGGKC